MYYPRLLENRDPRNIYSYINLYVKPIHVQRHVIASTLRSCSTKVFQTMIDSEPIKPTAVDSTMRLREFVVHCHLDDMHCAKLFANPTESTSFS
jgi:hypothetical protein